MEKSDRNKKIFLFIYNEALRDATQQKAYEGDKKWIKNVEKPKELAQGFVERLLSSKIKSQGEYDTLFIETAKGICEAINEQADGQEFTFGNAQKLINIIAKHFFVICYSDPGLRENFRFCHCPMDQIMLNKVWDSYVSENGIGKKGDFTKSWGKENWEDDEKKKFPNRYLCYQEAVRKLASDKKMFPIEYDYYTVSLSSCWKLFLSARMIRYTFSVILWIAAPTASNWYWI